jgi:hypothetical protein
MTRIQRLGIVLSVAWAIGAGWYQRSVDIERAVGENSLPRVAHSLCERGNEDTAETNGRLGLRPSVGHQDCAKFVSPEALKENMRIWAPWSNTLAMALVPIPVAWLLAWLLIRTGRWIWGKDERKGAT